MYQLIKPILFRLEAEQAHDLTSRALAFAQAAPPGVALMRRAFRYDDPALTVECAGLHFANPLGLAAGFDKRGALVAGLGALGFGHVEIGTVTPRPQPGNPQPRMFRLPEDQALINRLGFNSPGMLAAARNLRRLRLATAGHSSPIVGVNIGKNRDTSLERAAEDYLAAFVALAPLADYLTINISSPNTPGLRRLHERRSLEELLGALAERNRRLPQPRPLFLKVSPDESPAQLDDVVGAALGAGIAGLVACNTTLSRDGLRSSSRQETGGMSGRPLAERARQTIAHLYRASDGRLPIIGVGGIASAADAYGHIRAGASLVQLYTGLVYQGPGVAKAIKRDLATLLRRDGFRSVRQAVGAGLLS